MAPEELEKAIALMLEERPNEEKKGRRRRDKFKDLAKKARSGVFNLPDRVVEDLLGDDIFSEIKYVQLTYHDVESYIAKAYGWYDDMNAIAKELNVPKDKIRLRKITRYNAELDRVFWDGESHVYLKKVQVKARFLDKNHYTVTTRGIYGSGYYVDSVPIKSGVHEYNDEIISVIKDVFGKAPDKVQEKTRRRRWISEDVLIRRDTEGKYEHYRQALNLRNTSNLYGKTIPYEKGNIKGTKNVLISTVNAYGKIDEDTLNEIDDLAVNYEFASSNVVYDYIW